MKYPRHGLSCAGVFVWKEIAPKQTSVVLEQRRFRYFESCFFPDDKNLAPSVERWTNTVLCKTGIQTGNAKPGRSWADLFPLLGDMRRHRRFQRKSPEQRRRQSENAASLLHHNLLKTKRTAPNRTLDAVLIFCVGPSGERKAFGRNRISRKHWRIISGCTPGRIGTCGQSTPGSSFLFTETV